MASPMTAAQFLGSLRDEGLTVRETDGWRTRNRNHKGDWGPLYGVMVHHTAGRAAGAVDVVTNGYEGLPGPLCQVLIQKDGSIDLIGWGRCNHAGGGDPDVLAAIKAERYPLPRPTEHDGSPGDVDGNAHFVGYECVNLGDGKDPWPEVQLEAIARACAAVCRHYGWSVDSVLRHMDWSDWKSDPKGVDWSAMRVRIDAILAGKPNATPIKGGTKPNVPTKPTTPAKPSAAPYPGAGRFGPGTKNADVTKLGKMLVARGGSRFYEDGPGPTWSNADRDATRAFQQAQGWTGSDADGIPGPKTWNLLVTGKGKNIPAVAAKPVVSVAHIAAAARRDPSLPQGGATYEAEALLVEQALAKLGFLPAAWVDGSLGTKTRDAYRAFQRSLNYRGADADGIPGKTSLSILAARSGLFTLKN